MPDLPEPQVNGAPVPGTPPAEPAQTQPPSDPVVSPETPLVTPETPSVAPESTESPSQVAPTPQSIRDYYKDQGYDTSAYESDLDLAKAAMAGAQAYQDNQHFINVGRQMAPQQEEFLKWQAERKTQSEQQAGAEHELSEWVKGVPEYDPKWDALVRIDPDTGRYLPVDSYISPELPAKLQKFKSWQRDTINDLSMDPMAVMRKAGLVEYVQGEIQSAMENGFRYYDTARRSSDFVRDHAAEYFVLDKNGKPTQDPYTGQDQYTPVGARFQQWVTHLQNGGMTNPDLVIQTATQLVDGEKASGMFGEPGTSGQPQPAQPTQAAPTSPTGEINEHQKQAFIDRANSAARTPNRGGTAQVEDEPQNPNATFFEMAMPDMDRRGMIPRTG